MSLQHLLLATAIVLSSNLVVSAQFNLRSLIDGLTSKSTPTEEDSHSQNEEGHSSLDAPSLQTDPNTNRSSGHEQVDLDSLPTPLPTTTFPINASPRRPFQNDMLIHKQPIEQSITQASPSPHAIAVPTVQPIPSHPVNLHGGQHVGSQLSHSCDESTSLNRCSCHHGKEKPIVCLDSPNLPPPVSITGFYRTPLHYNNLWGDYLDEQVKARRKTYGTLLTPPRSVYASQCPDSQCSDTQCVSSK